MKLNLSNPAASGARRTARSSRLRQRGILLVECLIYIGMLMAITGVAFSTFYGFLTHHRAVTRCADDILRAVNAGEQWRADVRAAVSPPTLETSAFEQALQIPQKQGRVAYVFSERSVWRIVDDRKPDKPFLERVKTSQMVEDKRSRVAAWKWDLELEGGVSRKKARLKPFFTFLAVPATAATTNDDKAGVP